jgi:hypothetical protein
MFLKPLPQLWRIKMPLPKVRKCITCKTEFQPARFGQKACQMECAMAHSRANNNKKAQKSWDQETTKRKKALKGRSRWLKEAQVEFNRYIRVRDRGLPCVSCGCVEGSLKSNLKGGVMDAGHFLGTGSHFELRFIEQNCAAQCKRCNRQLSGNHGPYRIELIKRIGLEMVEFLEGPHEPAKYTIDDLAHIKAFYKDKTKALLATIED